MDGSLREEAARSVMLQKQRYSSFWVPRTMRMHRTPCTSNTDFLTLCQAVRSPIVNWLPKRVYEEPHP